MSRELVPWRDSFPRIPSVVNSRTFDSIWDYFFNQFDTIDCATEGLFGSNQVVPYDVRNVKENGKVVGTEFVYTLAGYSPEEVNVEVDNTTNTLTIRADKTEKEDESKYEYVRKGIARRSIQVSYHLEGVDKEKIKAEFKDGILKLYLPLEERAETKPDVRKIKLLKG